MAQNVDIAEIDPPTTGLSGATWQASGWELGALPSGQLVIAPGILPIGTVEIVLDGYPGNIRTSPHGEPGGSALWYQGSAGAEIPAASFAIQGSNGPPVPDLQGTPGTMILLQDDRSVMSTGQGCDYNYEPPQCYPIGGTNSPGAPFADFDVSGQTSHVDSGVFRGQGQVEGYSGTDDWLHAQSFFDLTFQLHVPSRIQLEGAVSAFDTQGFGGFDSTIRLTRGSTVLFSEIADNGVGPVGFQYDEVLPPGIYRLELEADGTPSTLAGFDFILAANPAIELPGLTVPGLILLAAMMLGSGRPRA